MISNWETYRIVSIRNLEPNHRCNSQNPNFYFKLQFPKLRLYSPPRVCVTIPLCLCTIRSQSLQRIFPSNKNTNGCLGSRLCYRLHTKHPAITSPQVLIGRSPRVSLNLQKAFEIFARFEWRNHFKLSIFYAPISLYNLLRRIRFVYFVHSPTNIQAPTPIMSYCFLSPSFHFLPPRTLQSRWCIHMRCVSSLGDRLPRRTAHTQCLKKKQSIVIPKIIFDCRADFCIRTLYTKGHFNKWTWDWGEYIVINILQFYVLQKK